MSLSNLQVFIAKLEPGEVGFGTDRQVERLLFEAWSEIAVLSNDAGIEPYKLLNRTERLTWNPPLLTFDIERHGQTVAGSVYASVYTWTVNITDGTASMSEPKRRQVNAKARPLKVQPLAEEIAALIVEGNADPRLKWRGTNKVHIDISAAVPAGNQQTASSRRKKFRTALERLLKPHGWRPDTVNTYISSTKNLALEPFLK